MRIFKFDKKIIDKKLMIAFCVVLVCGIICGIVLFNSAKINSYLIDYAQNYIENIYSFKNASLVFPRLLCEAVFCYAFYLISLKTVIRFVSLPIIFLRALFIGLYTAMLFSFYSIGGAVAALIVYLPLSLLSFACYFSCLQLSGCFVKKFRPLFPLALVLASLLIQIILVNVVFRVIIVIV